MAESYVILIVIIGILKMDSCINTLLSLETCPTGVCLNMNFEICRQVFPKIIQLALIQLKNGKAAGLNNINPEVLKVDPEITIEPLYPLLKKIWKEEKISEEWEEGLIIKYGRKETYQNATTGEESPFSVFQAKF
jgi:hypothetical protein